MTFIKQEFTRTIKFKTSVYHIKNCSHQKVLYRSLGSIIINPSISDFYIQILKYRRTVSWSKRDCATKNVFRIPT